MSDKDKKRDDKDADPRGRPEPDDAENADNPPLPETANAPQQTPPVDPGATTQGPV